MPAYGRLIIPDERDEQYPLRAALPSEPRKRKYRYWWARGWLGNQGNLPWCVAYSWLHWLEDGPRTVQPFAPGAGPAIPPRDLYCEAQALDPWIGDCSDPRYHGSSIRAGAHALLERGWIGEYRWTWDIEALIDAVLSTGPVVVGTWWYAGMDQPDEENFVRISGPIVGAHAYKIDGLNFWRGVARIKNSWGGGWGHNGFAWIDLDDLARLLRDDGEVCMAFPVDAQD